MDSQTLQLFTQQLAHWAESAIVEGRSPFRKVETFPRIVTSAGELRPPLVFWINRDSFMAGGVVFFPDSDPEQDADKGRACAEALGLRHFVTWGSRDVVFWEVQGQSLLRGKSLQVGSDASASADQFMSALARVLDELKILSVTGALPPDSLSPYYLANLCLGALEEAHTGLLEEYLVQRGESEGAHSEGEASQAASEQSLMTLLRLLALIFYDRLPATVAPEGLQVAMQYALDALPPSLTVALQPVAGKLPLPLESAVRFHHLFRRLTQLKTGRDSQRSVRLLEILLDSKGLPFKGTPLPSPEDESDGPALLLYPDRLYPAYRQPLEVASRSLCAATAMLRILKGLPPASWQGLDSFSVPADPAPHLIHGTLGNERIPDAAERKALAARLRTSWPTRRFGLPPRTPVWVWELLHLLGLAAPGCRLDLRVPSRWLTSTYGAALHGLLSQDFTLFGVLRLSTEHLQIKLAKESNAEAETRLARTTAEERSVPWGKLRQGHPASLALGLDLPDRLYAMFEEGRFATVEEGSWPEGAEREIILFSRSTIGRFFWRIVAGPQPLPSPSAIKQAVITQGLPLPTRDVLQGLRQIAWSQGSPLPPSSQIDRELTQWLGTDEDLVAPGTAGKSGPPPSQRPQASRTTEDELQSEIASVVFVDGLPHFPEQYLYDYYRPKLVPYTYQGPLRQTGQFLGQFTLTDQSGKTLEVEGEETARALLLASHSQQGGAKLPADRQLTATILERFLTDLRQLHKNLAREVHIRVPDPARAGRLIDGIWAKMPLPPWQETKDS